MQKNEFRAICKSRLKSHTARAARCEHYALLWRLERLIKFLKARKILIFLPSYKPKKKDWKPNLPKSSKTKKMQKIL